MENLEEPVNGRKPVGISRAVFLPPLKDVAQRPDFAAKLERPQGLVPLEPAKQIIKVRLENGGGDAGSGHAQL
jgi:hypothetical protein